MIEMALLVVRNWTLIVAAILGGAAGYFTGHIAGHHAGYVEGKAAMVVAVTKQNAVAADAARKAKSAIDECDEASGTWSQEDGTCGK